MRDAEKFFKVSEVWYQIPEDSNLWCGKHGIIVNTAALNEREFYYDIIRVAARVAYDKEHPANAWDPNQTLPNTYSQ